MQLDPIDLMVAIEIEFDIGFTDAQADALFHEPEELSVDAIQACVLEALRERGVPADTADVSRRIDRVVERTVAQANLEPLEDPEEIARMWDVFAVAHAKTAQPAWVAELVGDRPDDVRASCLGSVRASMPGEDWPMFDGVPARGVLQVDVRGLPQPPAGLTGVECLTVFVRDGEGSYPDSGGGGWLVRGYPDAHALIALEDPTGAPWRHIRWRGCRDMAAHTWCIEAHVPPALFDRFQESLGDNLLIDADLEAFDQRIEHHQTTKLGGWPSTIQSGPPWASFNRRPGTVMAAYGHVLQIGSHPELGLTWGDAGMLFLGAGESDGRREWVIYSECH